MACFLPMCFVASQLFYFLFVLVPALIAGLVFLTFGVSVAQTCHSFSLCYFVFEIIKGTLKNHSKLRLKRQKTVLVLII